MFSLNELNQDDVNLNNFDENVYNRLSTLLKSVASVSRALPAFRISRKQSCHTYIFLYHIHSDKPDYATLGKGYKSKKVIRHNYATKGLILLYCMCYVSDWPDCD